MGEFKIKSKSFELCYYKECDGPCKVRSQAGAQRAE